MRYYNVTIRHCCLPNIPPNIIIPPFPSSNNLVGVIPNFMNMASLATGGDYHLRTNPAALRSPCIDRGNTDYIFPLSVTDLEGKPRFINGGNPPTLPPPYPPLIVDMGALEV